MKPRRERPSECDRETRKICRSAEIFKGLSAPQIGRIVPVLPRTVLASGESLFLAGDTSRSAHVVLSGRLEVLHARDHQGSLAAPQLTTAGPGETVGEFSLIDSAPRSADVKALEPTTTLELSPRKLDSILVSHPRVGQRLLINLAHIVVQRIRATNDRLASTLDWIASSRPDEKLPPVRPADQEGTPRGDPASLDGVLARLLEVFDSTRNLGDGYEAMQQTLRTILRRRGYVASLCYALELNLLGSLGGWIAFLLAEHAAGRNRLADFARHWNRAFTAHCRELSIDRETALKVGIELASCMLTAATSSRSEG